MSEVTRVRRSPQEILEAKEAELVKAKASAALDAQMSSPTVMAITDKILAYSKARTDSRKGWNGNPSQTFENRLQSHTLWISEIQAEQELAKAQISLSDYISPKLRNLRNEVAQALANGDKDLAVMTAENGWDAILESADGLFSELRTCEGNLLIAENARKAFIESKKVGKAQATQVATA